MERKKSLPPGFRFHPTDPELVMYYLKRKVTGRKLLSEAIADVNIYQFSPWDLPGTYLFLLCLLLIGNLFLIQNDNFTGPI